jgi:hypothetical protein
MILEYGEPWWKDIDIKEQKNSDRTCPSVILSTTRTDPLVNPGLRGEETGDQPPEPWHGLPQILVSYGVHQGDDGGSTHL